MKVILFSLASLFVLNFMAQPALATPSASRVETRYQCSFENSTRTGMASCNAEIVIVQSRGFLGEFYIEMRVDCDRAELYHDDAIFSTLSGSEQQVRVLFQGITSQTSPTPPALVIEFQGHKSTGLRSILSTPNGQIYGACSISG